MPENIFFTTPELQLITKVNSYKKVESVDYYVWINESNPIKKFSFIDTIALSFESEQILYLKINDFDTGISVQENYDFENDKQQLENQFQGKITLKKVTVNELPLWQKAINNQFKGIEAEMENQNYLNNSLQIKFKNYDLEINFSPVDGLIVNNTTT